MQNDDLKTANLAILQKFDLTEKIDAGSGVSDPK